MLGPPAAWALSAEPEHTHNAPGVRLGLGMGRVGSTVSQHRPSPEMAVPSLAGPGIPTKGCAR